MGATISTLIEWPALSGASSAPSSGTTNGQNPPLPVSLTNYDTLLELIKTLERLCHEHPHEAKIEFKRPLQWVSPNLRPFMFMATAATASGNGGATKDNLWVVQGGGPRNAKTAVISVATKSDGVPLFQLEQISDGQQGAVFLARVSSFEYLNRALRIADELRLKELQELVRENHDPMNVIFGIPRGTFDAGNSNGSADALMAAFDALNAETEPRRREEYQKLYRLLLVVNAYDMKLMKSAMSQLERDKHLNMPKVTEEFQMLQAFCGKDQKCALTAIEWESDYTFANGCKAPPWRQVYGELCYIVVTPKDREKIIVTACKAGYYVNKGYSSDSKGAEHLNYEPLDGETFPTLTELLKHYSKHFAGTSDKQDYLYQPDPTPVPNAVGANNATDVGAYDQQHEGEASDDEHVAEEPNNVNRKGPNENKRNFNAQKKKVKAQHKTRSINEPSLKWRSLGINGEDAGDARAGSKKKGARSSRTGGTKSGAEARAFRGTAAGALTGKHAGRMGRSASVDEDEASDSESEMSSEEEMQEKRQENSELPAEYYQIQKLVKYLRCGNQTATIIAICSLRDFDLSNEFNQIAIRDVGGLETLVNLLDTDDPKCKMGALKILKEISQNVQIRSAIAELDGMQPLVELLHDGDEDLKCLAAETIAHCAKNASNRRAVRRYGGIRKLVHLLKTRPGSKEERVAISGALALASCSKSAKNKEAIQAAGSIPLLANLLESQNEALLIPVVGILQECASDENYRIAIRVSGMIKFLVENLASKNEELQTHCASAIFKCAEDDETRTLVRQYGGLTPLVNLLDNTTNKELLVAVTGAVWKCAQNLENVAALTKLNTIKKLVGLMENQPEDVLVNVVGALGACAKTADSRQAIRESGGITPLVNLLTGTNQALLVNVTTAVGACALDSDSMAIIDRLDGVRLLWSLLKSPSRYVQASAAWAISPCIEHAKEAGEMVRSFVGGLELIVSLLKSDDPEVLASVCAAIANIARDEENLAVITDHGVVPMLAKLTNTRNDKLRKHLAEAIARCCHWGNNRVAFGTAGAVAPLVKYLRSPDEEVHRSTARALHQLSMDPDNSITMHEHGVVQLLLGMVGSSDIALQEAAAGTIGNIRRLALASEKAALS
ncbi:Armadillo repeat-containing protein 4 [Quaeritorhiza haematococci]|nr:Armadillo repeat-containing protein 4 [Quaeritorhiza haematococci]